MSQDPNATTSTPFVQTRDDGGAAPVPDELLNQLKEEIRNLVSTAQRDIAARRRLADDVRQARWDGQSEDGLKHEEAIGERALPFEGASDARIRVADQIVIEHVMVLVSAVMRTQVTVRGLKLADGKYGSLMRTLLRWLLDNQLGADLRREFTRLANWMEGDSPAGAVMGVFWEEEEALRWQAVTLESLPEFFMQTYGLDAATAQATVAGILNPADWAQWADWLRQQVPGITQKRAKRAIANLRTAGHTRLPVPYTRPGRPRLTALRLFEDIFFPASVSDLKDAPYVFHREWLTEAQLRARERTHGYTADFIEALLQQEGKSGFVELFQTQGASGDGSQAAASDQSQQNRNQYEVLNAYYKAVNEDGVLGCYLVPFSMFVEEAARDRELLDYAWRGYNFVWFGREYLTARLWDSRGIPELAMTEQGMLKFLEDSFRDHTHLSTVPPIKRRRKRTRTQLRIGPLEEIFEDRPDEVAWMEPPKYPVGNEDRQKTIERRLAEYHGRAHPEVMPDLTRLHWQFIADQFLGSVAEVYVMLLKLAQQYMSRDQLMLVTGDDGQSLFRGIEDLEGDYSIQLTFNAGALDMEWIVKMAEVIAKYVLPIDTLGSVQRDRLLSVLMSNIDASLASATLLPVQGAQQREVDDEELNLVKIMAGVEPVMMKSGQNFGLRLQTLQDWLQKNPEIQQKLTPLSRKMLDARMEQLANQVQQEKNAQIGQRVGQTVFGG